MKMLTFFAFTGLINWLIVLLEPICRTWKLFKPVNAKKSQNFHFLNPRTVFLALILGNWENPPLPSDLKPPLTKRKFPAVSNTVLNLMEKFFCHAQHLVMSPYLILARPSGNLKKWTVSNLTFPWWTFAPINRIAYLRTISSAINLKAWDFSYMPFQQCAMINIA